MWDGSPAGQSWGGAYAYTYTADGAQINEWRGSFNGVFGSGQWRTVQLGVRLNDVNSRNGQLKLCVEGYGCQQKSNVKWRSTDIYITRLTLGVFHGGCNPVWSSFTPKASVLRIENLRVEKW